MIERIKFEMSQSDKNETANDVHNTLRRRNKPHKVKTEAARGDDKKEETYTPKEQEAVERYVHCVRICCTFSWLS